MSSEDMQKEVIEINLMGDSSPYRIDWSSYNDERKKYLELVEEYEPDFIWGDYGKYLFQQGRVVDSLKHIVLEKESYYSFVNEVNNASTDTKFTSIGIVSFALFVGYSILLKDVIAMDNRIIDYLLLTPVLIAILNATLRYIEIFGITKEKNQERLNSKMDEQQNLTSRLEDSSISIENISPDSKTEGSISNHKV